MPGAIIAAVIPVALFLIGAAALVAGIVILRTFGPRYRVGRLLSSTPQVTVAEALAAADGPARYVRIAGRIDAEDEFEDEHHRPLVLRRTRLDLRRGRDWRTFEDHRDLVRFEVREGLDGIAVDGEALDEGLVVVPRESVGTASDVADRIPAGTDPGTAVRLRVDQVSSVEQAIVSGVPRRGPDGTIRMTAGLGRPLVLSTMEPSEAMRVLAGGGTRRPLFAAICLGAGLVFVTLGALWAVMDTIL